MDTLMNLLPMTGWALVGAFAVVIVLALACFFFVRGMKMLHKAEEIAPHMMALEAIKAAIAKAEAEKDRLRSELENAKDTIARADTAKQYIKDHEPLVESMKREEELLKTNLDVAKERLQKATEAYTDLEDKNNKLYKQLTDKQQTLDFLEARHREVQAETTRLLSNKKNLEAAIGKLSEKRQEIELAIASLAAKQAELERLDREIERLRAQVTELTTQHTSLTNLVNDLQITQSKLNASIQELIAKESEAKIEYEKAQKELNALLAETEKLKNECQELNQIVTSLNEKKSELLRLERETERLRAQIADQTTQQDALTKQTNDLKLTQAKLNASIQELFAKESAIKAAYENAQKRLNDLFAEIEEKKKELEELFKRNKELTAKLTELEGKKVTATNDVKWTEKVHQGLQAQVAATKREIAELEGKLEARTKEWEGKNWIDTQAQDAWQDLDRPVISFAQRTEENEKQDEAGWLNWLNESLQNFGFEFPERTLRAFHTSLKCGEETPLVVLAGISGTGKSLLPELYAAAAGMNFLSVPVQPRWDGPQDVLGFYNYMEGRYKATELARFLWQADKWNNKNGKDAFPKDSLNIVLLDEMNLARVEYYFADFLSKLEQRQGKDLTDPVQRKQIELFLECGAGLGGRSLCVDTNTIFIGTMNEDETTQMLSDKVIDRSNLLRFGRPAHLTGDTDKGGFLSACQNETRVTRSLWDKWNARDNELSLDYEAQLEVLNEQFATIGRPFGHRIKRSVDAYMHAYPILGLDAEKVAFADQIEMKVLPKLNGLELETPGFSDVKAFVANTINQLNDDELLAAFQEAANPNQTFFRWRGVMRSN